MHRIPLLDTSNSFLNKFSTRDITSCPYLERINHAKAGKVFIIVINMREKHGIFQGAYSRKEKLAIKIFPPVTVTF